MEQTKPTQSQAGPCFLPLTRKELDHKPWKYIGYKELARYVSSDDDFLALRRFDRSHCRLLLVLQDQVAELEGELDSIDSRLSQRDAPDVDNGSVRKDVPERKEVLERLHRKINEYGQSYVVDETSLNFISILTDFIWIQIQRGTDTLLCQYMKLKSRPKAPRTTVKNITTWLKNNNGPIHPHEAPSFTAPDLITLAPSPKSAIRRLTEQYLIIPTKGLFGTLLTRTAPGESSSPSDDNDLVFQETMQGSDDKVDSLALVTIFVGAITMLIAPLWILAVVPDGFVFHKLAVITTFLVAFLAILTWGTLSKPFEILAATAGYSAVLVVFLQTDISRTG